MMNIFPSNDFLRWKLNFLVFFKPKKIIMPPFSTDNILYTIHTENNIIYLIDISQKV